MRKIATKVIPNKKPFQFPPFTQSVSIQILMFCAYCCICVNLFGLPTPDHHKVLVVEQVKQPWHETTHFPLLGKDQKPNVSQTLLLLTLKRYKLGELLHGPSENFLESWAFFVRFGESWCKETFEDGSGTLWGKFRWRDPEPGFLPHRHFPHTLFCANKNFFGNL